MAAVGSCSASTQNYGATCCLTSTLRSTGLHCRSILYTPVLYHYCVCCQSHVQYSTVVYPNDQMFVASAVCIVYCKYRLRLDSSALAPSDHRISLVLQAIHSERYSTVRSSHKINVVVKYYLMSTRASVSSNFT